MEMGVDAASRKCDYESGDRGKMDAEMAMRIR